MTASTSPIRVSRELNKAAAHGLFKELREAFVNVERIMSEIIDRKAWLTLGYVSFVEAWQSEMTDYRISSQTVLARVLYAMFDEGAAVEDVQAVVRGVGLGAEAVHEQWSAGVPSGAVTTVRRHARRLDRKPASVVHVPVSPEQYTRYEVLAERRGSTLKKEAAKALAEWFQ